MGKTSFHFEDEFFEEILNGIPQNKTIDETDENPKVNSITSISPDAKSRIKQVSKSVLYTEESRGLIINIIKKSKRDENKKFSKLINNKILKSIFVEKEDEDEEDDANEEVAKNGDGLLAKFKSLKRTYSALNKVAKTTRNVLLIVEQIRDYYENLSNVSVNSALSSRDKVIREMNVYTDKLFDETINPIMQDAVLPTASTTLLEVCNRGTIFFKSIIKKYYDFLSELMPPLIMKAYSYVISFIPGGKAISKGIDKAVGYYLEFKRYYNGSKLAKDIIENPEKYIALAATAWDTGSFLFALYGGNETDEDFEKLNKALSYSFDKLNVTGGKIISNLLSPSSRSSLSLSIDILGKNSSNLYDTGFDIFQNELDEIEENANQKIESLQTRQEKFQYVYELMTNIYTKDVEISPWSRMAKLVGGMVIRSQNLFDEVNEKLYDTVSSYSFILDQNKRPLKVDDISSYLTGIVNKTYRVDNFDRGKVKTLKIYPKKKVQKLLDNRPHYKAKIHTISRVMQTYKSPDENKKGLNAKYEKMTKQYVPNIVINAPESQLLRMMFGKYLNDGNVNVSAIFNYRYWKIQYKYENGNQIPIGKRFADETTRPFSKSVSFTKFSEFFDSLHVDEKYKFFLKMINEERFSHFSLMARRLFGYNTYSGKMSDIFYFKYNGKEYNDLKFVKYFSDIWKKNNDEDDYIGKTQMLTINNEALNDLKININGQGFTWMNLLNSDLFIEEFSLHRYKGMCVNLETAVKMLNYEIELKKKDGFYSNRETED